MGRTKKKEEQVKAIGRPKGKPRTAAERAADAKRTGRPLLPEAERGSKMLTVRFTQAEYNTLTKDAKKAGMVRTEYVRHCWRKIREIENGNDIPQSGTAEKPGNRQRGKRG